MLAKHNNVYGVLYGEEEPDEKGKKREFTTEKEYREWYAEYEAPKKEEGASLPCPLFNLLSSRLRRPQVHQLQVRPRRSGRPE
jgi:hypothetical protein